MAKISICIPTYNREKFISSTVRSVLSQTFKDFELIIRIDGSTDNTKQVLKSFKDKRIKVLENEKNIGYIPTMHRLTEDAETQWVQFLSDDDILSPTYLQTCYKVIQKFSDIGFVVTANNFIDSKGEFIHKINKKYLNKEDWYMGLENIALFEPTQMLGNFTMMSISMMNGKYNSSFPTAFPNHIFNKKYLKFINGSDPELFYNHDTLLVSQISCLARCVYIDEALVDYRIHANLSQAAGLSIEFVRQYFIFIEKFIIFLEENSIYIPNIKEKLFNSFEKEFFKWNGHFMRLASKGNSFILKNKNLNQNLMLLYSHLPDSKKNYKLVKILAYILPPQIINLIGIFYYKYVK